MSTDRSESSPDPERLRKRLRRQTAEVERREVKEAVSALDARGDLTEEQRETVRELGSALVEALTAPPERTLEQAGQTDRVPIHAISRLFELDDET
ncbi:glutamyl-tRNA reductase [Halorubrum sp. HHNYT27]|uniref:glutamyl-tRNA reductase n=1 Tax=Halorubrum sp. HHNYT27 TaxID=3402275 RepID=UPI003EC09031